MFSDQFLFFILWPMVTVLGNDRKSEIPSTGSRNGSLAKFRGLFLLDKVKTINIRQSLYIELLLLRIERSQLRWYGHVT